MSFIVDAITSVVSWVGETTGIDELNFEQQEEEEIAEATAQYEAEVAALYAQLNSASAAERLEAEKQLSAKRKSHDSAMKATQASFLKKRLLGTKEHKEKMAELEAGRQKTVETPQKKYDKGRIQEIYNRSRAVPTISPQQERGVGPTQRDTASRRPK